MQHQGCPLAPCHPSQRVPAAVVGPSLAQCQARLSCLCLQVVCQHYRRFGIPKDLQGVWRYLNSASETKEFKYTCPNSQEIIQAYRSVVRAPQ